MGFFKKKVKAFYAFANGTTVAIENVNDEVFASKMMGDGIAIRPSEGAIYAPCDGEVVMIMEHSLHAVGILNTDGIEILLHIGLDSVSLMGEGFCAHVKKQDQVKQGDLLITFDKVLLKEKGIDDISMLVITDTNKCTPVSYHVNKEVKINESILIEYK